MAFDPQTIRFLATRSSGEVSGRLLQPADATVLYVLAHGAGAGMDHPFMDSIARRLATLGVATLRYQFPYMEAGGRRPDPPPIAKKTVRSAVRVAADVGLPLIAGGRSFGGRMTAYAAADEDLDGVLGLAFLGFPLHPSGREGTDRWRPMASLTLPMLFLQGDRDRLANLELLRPLLAEHGPTATLCVVEGGDHSFQVLKRSGRSENEVLDELAATIAGWAAGLVTTPGADREGCRKAD